MTALKVGVLQQQGHYCRLSHQFRKPGFTRWLLCLQMAGTPGAAAKVDMELVKVYQDIKDMGGPLNSCEDATSCASS